MTRILLAFLTLCLLSSCKEDQIILPKPRIYPRVEYPTKSYIPFSNDLCPFSMEIPEYFQYVKDVKQNNQEKKHQCWFDLYCEELNTFIHFSYITFQGRPGFDKLVKDAFEMADKHNVKASYRDEIKISKPNSNVYGILFDIDGPVATPLQFYMTDSLSHFIRGSLYFKSEVNRDSIAPIYDFLKTDISNMLATFEWQ